MKLVLLESPYAGNTELNVRYAQLCMKDCLSRGEAPFASHLLYTQPNILNDTVIEERKLGIQAGFAWGIYADKTVVYTDLGISVGMLMGIADAKENFRMIEYRTLPDWKKE